MHARVTLFEIDVVRVSINDALALFNQKVLPQLRTLPGYQGVMAMDTPEGKGLLITFWNTEEEASASVESGFYDAQVAEFTLLLRQPPGREHYRVIVNEMQSASTQRPGTRP